MDANNKAIARRFIEAFNQKDLEGLAACVSPDVVNHALMPGMPQGLEGWKMQASMFFAAFPDIQCDIEDLVAEGDKVVTRWTCRGSNTGPMMGMPATDKHVTFTGITIDRYVDGKSVEHWEKMDMLSVLQQLGMAPAMDQAPS